MNKKLSVLLSSTASIAVCASLIAGSTFALFTSEAKTNIAVTAGKVHVEASANLVSGYSAKYEDGAYGRETYEPATEGDITSIGFYNGGSAQYDAEQNVLNVTNITPGDGVVFNLTAVNTSNVSIRYQTVVTYRAGGKLKADGGYESEDNALYRALDITVGEGDGAMKDISSDRSTAVSGWTTVAEKEGAIDPIRVEIFLPLDTDNAVSNMGCSLLIGIYAVQANGNDTTNGDVFLVDAGSDLGEVFEGVEDGDTVFASGDLEIPDGKTLEISGHKDIVFDVGGNTVAMEKSTEESQGVIVSEGSSLTIQSTGTERGLFEVNVTEANNKNDPIDGKYAMRVDGGALNLSNVDFKVNNDCDGQRAILLNGGSMSADSDVSIEMEGHESGYGVFVSEGACADLNGASVHLEGQMIGFMVGNGDAEKESVLNLEEGTDFDFANGSGFCAAAMIYPRGVVNMKEGSKITVKGAAYETYNAETGTYSGAYSSVQAIGCVGGGTFNMTGGEIVLNTECGVAYAFTILNNYYYGPEDRLPSKIVLDAHFELGGNAKISAVQPPEPAFLNAYIFMVQRNGEQTFAEWKQQGSSYVGTLGDVTLSGSPTVVLKDNVQFLYGDQEIKPGVELGVSPGSVRWAVNQGNHTSADLDYFTEEAISDLRNKA